MKEENIIYEDIDEDYIVGHNPSYEELQNKIDKAIEYIKENEFYLDYKTGACIKGTMPLLEILGDKENEK